MRKDRYPVKAVLILVEGRLDDPVIQTALDIMKNGKELEPPRKLDVTNVSIRALDLEAVYEGAFR